MTKRSITGRPEISAIMREVWSDQIDNFGADCPVCQMEGQVVECNVYVPVADGRDTVDINTCRCYSVVAVLNVVGRDFDRNVIIEFSGGDRK